LFYRETDFVLTPVGEKPRDWSIRRLQDIVKIVYGKNLPIKKLKKTGYEVFGANGIIGHHDRFIYEKPHVLISCRGAYSGEINLSPPYCFVTNNSLICEIVNQKVNTVFLYYALKSYSRRGLVTGSAQPQVTINNANLIEVAFPSLMEQQGIVEVLSCVDLAIQKTDEVIAKTEHLKKGLMQKLLTEGIGHREFIFERKLGCEVPKEWKIVSIYDIKSNIKGAIVSGPFGSNIGKRFFVDEGVPVIRGNNLTQGEQLFVDDGFVYITEEKAEELKSCVALQDDLIFTAAGTLGQVGLIPKNSKFPRYIISNKQLRARIDTDRAFPLFLFYWFSNPIIKRIVKQKKTGTSIPLINLNILRSLPIPLPESIDEQKEIAKILYTVDSRLGLERKQKAKLERIKQGLMDLLLSGKVRIKVD
jgi:restriction endonuclease S subunit